MSFKPSAYQQAVYDHITNGKGNAVIDAVAGSGKSTTIVNALKLIPNTLRVLFLAFNKAIVEELKIKVGQQDNAKISTLHSLGFGLLRNTLQRVTLDNRKYLDYVKNGLKYKSIRPTVQLSYEQFDVYKENILTLIDLARVNLCNGVEELSDIANKYDVLPIDNEFEVVFNAIDWGKSNTKIIDYTDMIYLPNVLNIDFRKEQYDYVFIDECQDLNAAQREMFLKTVKPQTGRFVAVGDPRQAIYGFAGADVHSFELLKAIPNTTLLPLSVCYRCDSDIIDLAKTIVPQIEARDNAEKGVIEQSASYKDIKDGDMVLCRVTAPLVQMCMRYIAEGVKAYVKGRDIGVNLINLIKKTNRNNMTDVMDRLAHQHELLANNIAKKKRIELHEARTESAYTAMADKIAVIAIISEGLTTANEVMRRIENIFKDDQKQGICLSTIHKAKGLESERVYILRRDKMFLPHCMRIDWMAEQEYNLAYVAYTRAKKYLGFITDFAMDDE